MFIDFSKAFDSPFYDKIWSSLASQGVQTEIIALLDKIYKNCAAQIRLDLLGRHFKIKRGVRQGDPLSTNVFNAVLEQVFRKLNWKGRGLEIKSRGGDLFEYVRLNKLTFADNVVIIAKSGRELQSMADDLAKSCLEMGLTINRSKPHFNLFTVTPKQLGYSTQFCTY